MRRSLGVFALLLGVAGLCVSSALGVTGFVQHGNAICEGYYKKLNRIPTPTKTTLPALVAYEKRTLPLAQSEFATFKAITPPSSQATTYKAWLTL